MHPCPEGPRGQGLLAGASRRQWQRLLPPRMVATVGQERCRPCGGLGPSPWGWQPRPPMCGTGSGWPGVGGRAE
eukprot:11202206-Lingulodinium_polyedra.AAC.1